MPDAGDRSPMESSQRLSAMGRSLSDAEAIQALVTGEERSTRDTRQALGLPSGRPDGPLHLDRLQRALRQAMRQAADKPAIVRLQLSPGPGSDQVQVDQILVLPSMEVRGWRAQVSASLLSARVRAFQRLLSQHAGPAGERAVGAELVEVLLGPLLPMLHNQGVNALWLSLDRGLQAIPYAALPWGEGRLADRFALTITPTLGLSDLASTVVAPRGTALLAGASRFNNGLAPLPMVVQELEQVAALYPGARLLLNQQFTPASLLTSGQPSLPPMIHLATHADFQPGRAASARLHTGTGELSLDQMGHVLRQRQPGSPLDLLVLSGCRTTLGDEDSELGIAGLALQAGAHSALGNLWYVDDVVSAAFYVQFHRLLSQGLSKDRALQKTQLLFRTGLVKLRDDQIVSDHGGVLIHSLASSDQARLVGGLHDPFYWAGVVLSGRPW